MYIGGTVHLLRASDYPLPKEFDEAYEKADLLVFETDLAELSNPETQQAIMAKGAYTDGRTLDKVLSTEAYKTLEQYCTGVGLPMASLNQFKPSMVILTLLGLELQKLGVSQEGVDLYYYRKSIEDEKKYEGLETVEEQIDLITSMGAGDESNYIIFSIRDLKRTGEVINDLITSWKKADEEKMKELLQKELKEKFPGLYKAFIVDRNMNWLVGIENYLKTPETEYVLVGMGHLIGKDGVIEQLQKRGYKVEKLSGRGK
jgi:uncharacterized protein YbaP (TraB family)